MDDQLTCEQSSERAAMAAAYGRIARVVFGAGVLALLFGCLLPVVGTVATAAGATPIAVDDFLALQKQGQPVVIDVLANDIDADDDLDGSSILLLPDPINNPALQETRYVVDGEGVWEVVNGQVVFTPCTEAGIPADAACTGLFADPVYPMEYVVSDANGDRSNPAIIMITFDDGTTVPVTLGYITSTRDGERVTIAWQTATESANAGFHFLAPVDGALVQVTTEMIPSKVIDSVEPTDYSTTVTMVADTFYLQEVSIDGETALIGPFRVGRAVGVRVDPGDDINVVYLPYVVTR